MTIKTPNREYDTWAELIEHEANGYAVTVRMSTLNRTTEKRKHFTRLDGPHATREDAKRAMQRIRRALAGPRTPEDEHRDLIIHGLAVEPLWKDLNFKEKR